MRERMCGYECVHWILGDQTIPEEKRKEFTNRVLKILDEGGMLWRDHIRFNGKDLLLLASLYENDNGMVDFCYNYFVDDGCEITSYRMKDAALFADDADEAVFGEILRQ